MKVKEARNRLSNYTGDELYREACRLYQKETDFRIQLRSHGKPPSIGLIESVVKEMKPWMLKVGAGLPWDDDELLKNTIEWETGRTWVRYEMTDPRVEEFGKSVRLEVLRGTPYPLAAALTPEYLNAISSKMIAEMQQKARKYLDDKKNGQE